MTVNAAASASRRIPTRVYLVLLIGIAAVSLAAIFIRFAQEDGLPSLFIAAGRLTLSALVLTPWALRHHSGALWRLQRGDFLLAAISGFLLAIHFASWITSLEFTTVLISVVFVATGPLWVALLEMIFLRTRLGRWVIIGLLGAFVGGMMIGLASGGAGESTNPLLGALLALTGALAFAAYLVIGRKLRAKLDLLPYIWLVYSCAAIFLVLMVLLSGIPPGPYPVRGYLLVLVLALVPQLIGHTSFNFALRYLPATFVGIATQM